MNITATFEKLSLLRLHGFERVYRDITQSARQEKYTLDELIGHMVDAEFDDKYNKKLSRLLKQARLRQQASFEQIDFNHPRGLDKNQVLRLQSCDWIKKSRDLLITGSTGLGKSFLACAFGHQACVNQFRVLYVTANKLLDQLMFAKADGTYFKVLDMITKNHLLIIDDFGLRKIDHKQCTILLDVADDRHGKGSTIVTSQLPVKSWYDCFAEPTIADAILDRWINGSFRIDLDGPSMRKILENKEENVLDLR
ncbi:MAG TPA: IS21-like element helper ATPase IstB [Bacteroidales bacterium]|nr:IS21-like element helper ATPase IstB [Bacteroidales bacterium]HPT12854.1 IS21-like element helper ATPase IstB [Bacteroidales bacterium]